MPALKRRHFLQLFGSTLATIGLSEAGFFSQADRVGQALAQPTARKLALLVGINAYPPPVPHLAGCLTDVDLQYHLLVHRFGFNPADIVIVADNQSDPTLTPSRENILRAFQDHLGQAQAGDVVVFHYSGHGGRVVDPHPIEVAACGPNQSVGLNGTLIPNDPFDLNQLGSEWVVPDIMGRTLFLLANTLKTENVTMILDSCYSGAGTRGSVTVRSVGNRRLSPNQPILVASPAEFALQERLRVEAGLTEDEFHRLRSRGIAKGVALGSASCNQEAVDAHFGSFHAGAFSYLLTRYLWQLPATQAFSTVQANLRRSTRAEARLWGMDQDPILEVQPDRNYDRQSFYFLPTVTTPSAGGVVTAVNADGTAEFWLGGVSSDSLDAPDTIFTVRDRTGRALLDSDGNAVMLQKNGLTGNPLVGRGTLVSEDAIFLEPGQFLQEQIVGLPAHPQLMVGVDPSLETEMETAIATLEATLQTASAPGETVNRLQGVNMTRPAAVDCILARVNDDLRQRVTASTRETLPSGEVYALFTPTLTFISQTDGSSGETLQGAIARLAPRFRTLLAAKVLRAIASTESDLQVSGEVFSETRPNGPRLSITTRALGSHSSGTPGDTVPFTAGDVIQLAIQNDEDRAVYVSCLIVNSRGDVDVLHPARWDAPEEASRIAEGERLVIPRAEDEVVVTLGGSGFLEVITLVSMAPLRNALRGLQSIARGRGQSRGSVRASDGDPVSLIDALLGDVDRASRSGNAEVTISALTPAVDSRAIAAFSTLLEVRS